MKEYLYNLIQRAKDKEAIDNLLKFIESIQKDEDFELEQFDDIYRQGISIAGQLTELKQKEVTGILSHDEVTLQYNVLRNDLLKLISYLYSIPLVGAKNKWLETEVEKIKKQSSSSISTNNSSFIEESIFNQVINGFEKGKTKLEDIELKPVIDSKLVEEVDNKLKEIEGCLQNGEIIKAKYLFYELKNGLRGKHEKIFEFEKKIQLFDNNSSLSQPDFEIAENLEIVNEKINPGLNVQNITVQLAEIIMNLKDESGMMIGLFGRWGRGKTYFWKQLKSYFEDNSKMYTHIEFHAWKYQEMEALWAYIYEAFLNKYYNKPKGFNVIEVIGYQYLKLRLNLQRKGWVPILKAIIVLLLGGIISYQLKSLNDEKVINSISSIIGVSIASISTVIGVLGVIKKEYTSTASDLFKHFSKDFSFKELLGVQAEIQKELIILLKVWMGNSNEKILFFIDDLDRCSHEQMLKTIDSVRVMLDDKEISEKVIVLSAIDERLLKKSIKIKYSNDSLVREHMDKLFLISLKLPELNFKEKNEIFDLLTIKRKKVREPSSSLKETSIQKEKLNKTTESSSFKLIENSKKTPKINEAHPRNKNVSLINKEKYDLTFSEYNIIQDLLLFFDYATPRGIRIFYNRYLLAKNLLKLKLDENPDIIFEWSEFSEQKILPALIIQFSIHETSEEIPKIRKKISESNDSGIIKHHILGEDYFLNKELLLNMLTVVEMVVAY